MTLNHSKTWPVTTMAVVQLRVNPNGRTYSTFTNETNVKSEIFLVNDKRENHETFNRFYVSHDENYPTISGGEKYVTRYEVGEKEENKERLKNLPREKFGVTPEKNFIVSEEKTSYNENLRQRQICQRYEGAKEGVKTTDELIGNLEETIVLPLSQRHVEIFTKMSNHPRTTIRTDTVSTILEQDSEQDYERSEATGKNLHLIHFQ